MDFFLAAMVLGVIAITLHNWFWFEANLPQIVGRVLGVLALVVLFVAGDSDGPLLWLATGGFAVSVLLGVLGLVVRRWPDKIDERAMEKARGRARRAR